jgi:hypothetical protein
MQVEGSCHCGAISFTAQVDPERVMVCHCSDCQVMSGSPFRAVVPAPVDTFALRGEPKRYIKTADSGNRRVQAFCGDCGTPLFATAPEHATQVVIRTGCLKQKAQLVPQAQIWQRSALPWIAGVCNLPGSGDQQAFVPPRPGVPH